MLPLRARPITRYAQNMPRKPVARNFSASAFMRAQFYARTTVSPSTSVGISVPPHIQAKSVILLSTPQNLPLVIENAIALHHAKIQVVVAGVDRVVPNGICNGISELWLDELLHIKRSTLSPKDPQNATPRESDGIHAVGAKENWKNIEGSISMTFGTNRIAISLANTLFATNTPTTLFYFGSGENMGQTLAELELQAPVLEPELQPAIFSDRWTPLTGLETLTVTTCTGNLVKRINGQLAALFLEKDKKLMDLASKSTKVYVKIYNEDGVRRYEVIAGGGGWGAKSDLLALSPEALVKKGDRLEFFMLTPDNRYKDPETAVVSGQFLFESPLEATSYAGQKISTQTVEHLFGGGSELGLWVNGVSHSSPGESVRLPF